MRNLITLKHIMSRCFQVMVLSLFLASAVSAGEKILSNSLGMEFTRISPGTFDMGSPDNEPYRGNSETQHQVTLTKPYYIQTTEVTVKQWQQVMGRRMFGMRGIDEEMPISKVSWHEAKKYIAKLNQRGEGRYRLPTEAEWEYACRSDATTAYSWGDTIACSQAMYANNTKSLRECVGDVRSRGLTADQPAPVKSYPPNQYGVHDMSGNVWEWCEDVYRPYGSKPVTDPLVTDGGAMRVRRGGSYFKHGYSCRCANRAFGHPSSRLKTTGFRLVFEPD
jgi:formylglycine-generating enzyme required for sulfatase activity